MNRLAGKIAMPLDIKQVSNHLLDAEGTCTCGRVMRKLDAKIILMTAVPTKEILLVGAYCINCSRVINDALKSLRSVTYSGTETAPGEPMRNL